MQFGRGGGLEERRGWDLVVWRLRQLSWRVLPWKIVAGRRQRKNAEELAEQLRKAIEGK